jgi:hypothetical protein
MGAQQLPSATYDQLRQLTFGLPSEKYFPTRYMLEVDAIGGTDQPGQNTKALVAFGHWRAVFAPVVHLLVKSHKFLIGFLFS